MIIKIKKRFKIIKLLCHVIFKFIRVCKYYVFIYIHYYDYYYYNYKSNLLINDDIYMYIYHHNLLIKYVK